MVGAINHHHFGIGMLELVGHGQPAESSADDHHPFFCHGRYSSRGVAIRYSERSYAIEPAGLLRDVRSSRAERADERQKKSKISAYSRVPGWGHARAQRSSSGDGLEKSVSTAQIAGDVSSGKEIEPIAGSGNEDEVLARVKLLVEEGHVLRSALMRLKAESEEAVAKTQQLKELNEQLTQCWDLVRQRRARREYGLDPGRKRYHHCDTRAGRHRSSFVKLAWGLRQVLKIADKWSLAKLFAGVMNR